MIDWFLRLFYKNAFYVILCQQYNIEGKNVQISDFFNLFQVSSIIQYRIYSSERKIITLPSYELDRRLVNDLDHMVQTGDHQMRTMKCPNTKITRVKSTWSSTGPYIVRDVLYCILITQTVCITFLFTGNVRMIIKARQ